MSIRDTLNDLGFQLAHSDEPGEVYGKQGNGFNILVSLGVGDGIIQAVKMPESEDQPTTVIHFNRTCDELADLLRKWSGDVTPAVFN